MARSARRPTKILWLFFPHPCPSALSLKSTGVCRLRYEPVLPSSLRGEDEDGGLEDHWASSLRIDFTLATSQSS